MSQWVQLNITILDLSKCNCVILIYEISTGFFQKIESREIQASFQYLWYFLCDISYLRLPKVTKIDCFKVDSQEILMLQFCCHLWLVITLHVLDCFLWKEMLLFNFLHIYSLNLQLREKGKKIIWVHFNMSKITIILTYLTNT